MIMKKLLIILCLLFMTTGCGGEDKKAEDKTTEVSEQKENIEDKKQESETNVNDEREEKEKVKLVPVELENVTVMCPEDHELVEKIGVYFSEEVSENNYVGISFMGVNIKEATNFETLKQLQKEEVMNEYGSGDFNEIEIAGYKVALAYYNEKVGESQENEVGVWEHMVYLGDKATSKCNVYMIGVITGKNPLDGYGLSSVEEMIKTAVPKE